MSQFAGQRIMPRIPLEPAEGWVTVRRDVAGLHDRRSPGGYLVMVGRAS